MGASKIKNVEPSSKDGYTSTPTHLRFYKEEGEEYPWSLDGADDEGNYTESVCIFHTLDECIEAAPDFIKDAEESGVKWNWRGQR